MLYGDNIIDVPVKPYHVLFVDEVLHPFYIFQILAVIFWVADVYYYYSGITSLSLPHFSSPSLSLSLTNHILLPNSHSLSSLPLTSLSPSHLSLSLSLTNPILLPNSHSLSSLSLTSHHSLSQLQCSLSQQCQY